MPARRDITTGQQTLTAAGVVTGSLDTSGIAATDDLTLHLTVSGLTAGKTALIALEDTASATPFSDKRQVAVAHFVGAIAGPAEIQLSWRRYQLAALRTGAANCALRANLLALDGSTSITLQAQLE